MPACGQLDRDVAPCKTFAARRLRDRGRGRAGRCLELEREGARGLIADEPPLGEVRNHKGLGRAQRAGEDQARIANLGSCRWRWRA
jgi:hypothetical protein